MPNSYEYLIKFFKVICSTTFGPIVNSFTPLSAAHFVIKTSSPNFIFGTSLTNPKARLQDQRLLLHLAYMNGLQSNQACQQLAKPRN